MAAIDKTYLNNWDQFEQAREWARNNPVVLKNGKKVELTDYMYEPDLTREEWEKREDKTIILWNTPSFVDIHLIRNCPLDFIQERLKEQYGGGWSKMAFTDDNEDDMYEQIKNRTSIYDTFQRNGLGKKAKVVFHNYGYVPRDKKCWWWVQTGVAFYGWWYNEDDNMWYHEYECMPKSSNTAHFNGPLTKKNIVNIVKRWDLPKGFELKFTCWLNKYASEFTVTVK